MTTKTDLLIQYALRVAADNEDPYRRSLGPIHLIKYVYLGDLAHAVRNSGQTFTGTRWTFFSFGHWSRDVNGRVDPAAQEIEANREQHPSKKFERDAIRFDVEPDDRRIGKLEELIPPEVAAAIRSAVRTHGNDTKSLLRDVYLTEPMLNAAPGEDLDFSTVSRRETSLTSEGASNETAKVETAAEPRTISTGQRKKIAAEAKRRLEASAKLRDETFSAVIDSRYDDVFSDGIRLLDELAGTPMPEFQTGGLHFSDSIWKDPARRDTKR